MFLFTNITPMERRMIEQLVTMNVEMLWEEAIIVVVRVVSWHLPGRFDGIRKVFQPICGPRFATRTTQI
jgi:hypothetical protein